MPFDGPVKPLALEDDHNYQLLRMPSRPQVEHEVGVGASRDALFRVLESDLNRYADLVEVLSHLDSDDESPKDQEELLKIKISFKEKWNRLSQKEKLELIAFLYKNDDSLDELYYLTRDIGSGENIHESDEVILFGKLFDTLRYNDELKDSVLGHMHDPKHLPVFEAYLRVADEARNVAKQLHETFKNHHPNSVYSGPGITIVSRREKLQPTKKPESTYNPHGLNQGDFYQIILQHADKVLEDYLKGHAETQNFEIVQSQLELALSKLKVADTFFDNVAHVLDDSDDLELRFYAAEQEWLLDQSRDPETKSTILRVLHEYGELSPIPEIFWRVDRSEEEYRQRFGLDIRGFLTNFSDPERKQVLLEFGPGNGTFRQERSAAIADGYVDFALSDKLYYPVNTLIRSLIDFDHLASEGIELSDQEQVLLSDFLYKILVIKTGQSSEDTFEYDEAVLSQMKEDPSNIIQLLKEKAPLLKSTLSVPAGGNVSGGSIEYEAKIHRPDSAAFSRACEVLSQSLESYLKPVDDIYEHMPAYPPGTIIGDFNQIEQLQNGQLDMALGVRSTVYKTGEDYHRFMVDMTQKLSEDGLYIDDNVRENFGASYRLEDLKKIEAETGYPLHIILGPGMEGEDYREGEVVPLAVVMTHSDEKLKYISENLSSGYTLKPLSEVGTSKMAA